MLSARIKKTRVNYKWGLYKLGQYRAAGTQSTLAEWRPWERSQISLTTLTAATHKDNRTHTVTVTMKPFDMDRILSGS